MAKRPLRHCLVVGCRALTRNPRYCEKHAGAEPLASRAVKRESSTQRGYNYKWQKARAGYLLRNPLCLVCLEAGVAVTATNVDHRVPHKGSQELFWDKTNWQGLCASCHSTKTASEDGGFGNASRSF